MAIYKKMYNVMLRSKSLEKNTLEKNTEVAGQYKAVGEKDMLNVIKPLLKEEGLIIFPIDSEVKEVPKGNKTITQVKVSYKVVDIDTGESEILSGIGNGADTQDKGAGKAFTYAYKAMLSKTFMLFSGEDTDNHHSDVITADQLKQAREELTKFILDSGKELEKVESYYKIKVASMSLDQISTVRKTVEKSLESK